MPSILFDDIRIGKMKLTESLDFQNQFKCEVPDIKIIITILFNAREKIWKLCNVYVELTCESKRCPLQGKGIQILTPKRMLQRLPIALEQVKPSNTFENLLNEIGQILYFLYWSKEITKRGYSNIMNSIQIQYKMDTTFMNTKNHKTSNSYKLLLKLSKKINLKRVNKYVALSNLSPLLCAGKYKKVVQKQYIFKITWWIILCIWYSRIFWVHH